VFPATNDQRFQQMMDDSDSRALSQSSFANLLRQAGDAFGDRIALVHGKDKTHFADLHRSAGQMAQALRGIGIEPGDVCAVLAKDPRDAAATFFAAVPSSGNSCSESLRSAISLSITCAS
jgi:non-ribosomal peptide synthetase component E (peptide arylation enzyme)